MSAVRSAAGLISGIPAFLFRSHFRVLGESMLPAFHDGDLLHVVPRSWTLGSYRRGAVVVAESPAMPGEFWVKRVIGLPGEIITFKLDGSVLIDGFTLYEPYPVANRKGQANFPPWPCDQDEYFLMGDNRADSGDCRRYGPVPAHSIVGRVWLSWPPRRVGATRRQPQ